MPTFRGLIDRLVLMIGFIMVYSKGLKTLWESSGLTGTALKDSLSTSLFRPSERVYLSDSILKGEWKLCSLLILEPIPLTSKVSGFIALASSAG
jgi:hypothetical protein